jgi:hypothetical protein
MKQFTFYKLEASNISKRFNTEREAKAYAKKLGIATYEIQAYEGYNKTGRV